MAFGIDLETPPESDEMTDNGLHGLLLKIAQSYENIRSPFSGYLCGFREISLMSDEYGNQLEEAAESMRKLLLMLMVDLVERIWGDSVSKVVSQKKLESCGHPGVSEPDPADYF